MAALQSPQARIVELDALRGLAVIGIAWMNVHVYAMPAQAYYNPLAWGYRGPADLAVWWFDFLFVADEFRVLFAMLFGAGVAMLWDRAGSGRWSSHLARMAVLFAIGVAHATLVASNDILRAYALAGLFLPLAMGWPIRWLVMACLAMLALHLAAGSWWLASQPDQFFAYNYGTDPRAIQIALERGSESFDTRIARRIATLPASLAVIATSVPLNLSAMLAGLCLWRSGSSNGSRDANRSIRLVMPWAFAALAAMIALGWWTAARGVFAAPFTLVLGIAYGAAGMAVFGRWRESLYVRLLAATGRMSLTNYMMTSVILAVLCASWGFGLFAQVSRVQALALSFIPGAAMLLWSLPWLRRFGQGPAERIWRGVAQSLASGRRGA